MSAATFQVISNVDVNIVMVWVILAKGDNIVSIDVYFDYFKYGNCLFSN